MQSNTLNELEINIAITVSKVGIVIDGGQVMIFGEQNNLYCEFVNNDKAISDIIESLPNLLDVLSKEYNLALLLSYTEPYAQEFMESKQNAVVSYVVAYYDVYNSINILVLENNYNRRN